MLALLLISFILLSLNQPGICLQQRRQMQSFLLPNQCNDKCGSFHIPFPFHLNASCSSVSNAFHLSCLNSTTLYVHIGIESYRVLDFFSDGILTDFPGSSTCRQYNDLKAFDFSGNDYFGISDDNVIGLYDCEDSSLCKADCETNDLPGCDGNSGGSLGCCYPLSDQSIWHSGDGFSSFSKFGCRGFSSWVVPRGTNAGKRGVKLEWAIPRNTSERVCVSNADVVNATTVEAGVRCSCKDGFVGDGFANGAGCLKSCIKEGQEAYGMECNSPRHSQRKLVIVAGVLAPVFILASLFLFLCILKRPVKPGAFDLEQAHYHSTISFRKACRTRLFSYRELNEATRAFEDGLKLVDGTNGTIHAGVLGDGSHIAVQKVQCENERDLIHVLSGIELLSAVLHRNLARLLGCCIDSGYTLMVVYEYPANGTLEEQLQNSGGQKFGLDWYKRLSIAAETASVLAYLQYEISPPVFHHGLKSSGYIFLDVDFSVKIAGFALLSSGSGNGSNLCNNYESPLTHKNDVYDFGMLLLEIISGSKYSDMPSVALQKIRSGKLEEIVDPSLYYHEQPNFRREQIEIVADIATRCLLFGGDGKIGMIDVARELVHTAKESIDGGSKRGATLEETFSNSSLLQMISMSPDSMHVP
ncbi:probably inactive receptor-like protein kinase At2g46850 [Durio zibethinus]|uniref:Probably inactive receptor-like protein kinase At2g46850 n=1 Tax=Durio zibethinus TaxID=66656 RepID=A0A6P6A4I3_DURZI|nr:probably inactive receptor-like protein kinase At2g46850 [Durio zibethinus]